MSNRKVFQYDVCVELSKVSRENAWDTTYGAFELLFNDVGSKGKAPSSITRLNDNENLVIQEDEFKDIERATPEIGTKSKCNLRLTIQEIQEPMKGNNWRR